MAKMEIQGLAEYAQMLNRFEGKSDGMIKAAIYEGADVVADAVMNEIRALPTENGRGSEKQKLKGISTVQKKDLIDAAGLADMDKNENGDWNTKYGFDGYGSVPSKKYPKGLPNILLVRSIVAGNSFRAKNPFIRRAVNKCRPTAEQAMEKKIDEAIRKEFE